MLSVIWQEYFLAFKMAGYKKRGRPSLRRAANPEERLPAVEPVTKKVIKKTTAKKTDQKRNPDREEIMRKAKKYHKLKKQVLVRFFNPPNLELIIECKNLLPVYMYCVNYVLSYCV